MRRLESALNVLMYEWREVSKVYLLEEYAAILGTSRRKEYRGRLCDELKSLTTITVSKKNPFIWSIQQNRKTSVSSVSLIAVLAKNWRCKSVLSRYSQMIDCA